MPNCSACDHLVPFHKLMTNIPMTNIPKVLLAAPTSTYKQYIFLEWYLHAYTLSYPNSEILIVDNSHDKNYHKELLKMGINVLYCDPSGKTNHEYITESQNMLRDYFLKSKAQYYFSYEVDIFGPRNIIEQLMAAKKDVISAPYFIDYGHKSRLLISYFEQTGEKKWKTIFPEMDKLTAFMDGTVKQTYENGIGCTLIKRHVLEKIRFRIEKFEPGHSDKYFYMDLWESTIHNFIDTSVLVRHFNSDWGLNIDNK